MQKQINLRKDNAEIFKMVCVCVGMWGGGVGVGVRVHLGMCTASHRQPHVWKSENNFEK